MRHANSIAALLVVTTLTACQGGGLTMPDLAGLGEQAGLEQGTAAPQDAAAAETDSTTTAAEPNDAGTDATGPADSATAGGSPAAASDGADTSTESPAEPAAAEAESVTLLTADEVEEIDPSQPTNRIDDIDLSGTVRHGWSDAEAGWMARLRMPDGTETIMEVVEAHEKALLMENRTMLAGRATYTSRSYMPRFTRTADTEETPDYEIETVELPDETIDVGGVAVPCTVVKTIMKISGQTITSRTWTSEEVPGWMVRSESDAMGKGPELMGELIEFRKS